MINQNKSINRDTVYNKDTHPYAHKYFVTNVSTDDKMEDSNKLPPSFVVPLEKELQQKVFSIPLAAPPKKSSSWISIYAPILS